MGAIKPRQYSHQEIQLALINRALAHPIRIQIMKLVFDEQSVSITAISKLTGIALTTAKEHVEKLYDGQLIYYHYDQHSYTIYPNPEIQSLVAFLISYHLENDAPCSPFASKLYF
jgi:DNA-binding transcriptional ArsR family regulator